MTEKLLRWGILSTARINRRFIPPLVNQAKRSTLVAVASRDATTAQTYADEWQIPQTFDSYDALLASAEIDAVYIPLPNSLHKEWVIKAAQAKKHILCEKPLALTVNDVDEMAQAAADNGVTLIEAFHYRMHPQLTRLKAAIAEGMIGRVKYVRATFSFVLNDESNIRLNRTLGGGSLWDVGCYPVSFCQAIGGGNPVEVFAWQNTLPSGVEVSLGGQLHYSNGVLAQIDSSFEVPYRAGAEVVGTAGSLIVPNPWLPDLDGKPSGLMHIAPDDTETGIATEIKHPFLCEIEAMEKVILDGDSPPYTLADSRGNIATITALYQSAAEGKAIQLAQGD